jgi:hypothetical protein
VFGFLKGNPVKKWKKEHESLVTRAFHAQRNGDIRLYSTLTAEAEALKVKIESSESGRVE